MSVALTSLGHRFTGGPWLFRNLNHSFESGLTAVVGPSGTGKSTLLQIMIGALSQSEGQVLGMTASDIALVHQISHGVAGRSVRDHLALPLIVAGYTRAEADLAAARTATSFGLDKLLDAPYRQLSGGEAQRLMLGVALNQNRGFILADEPTASLDSSNAQAVIATLRVLSSTGSTVIIATHDERIRSVCDEVLDLAEWNRPHADP